MGLIKREYKDKETIITAENMNDIQDAILDLEDGLFSVDNDKSGEVITITDAAKRGFRGLNIFGKTTQGGTPTPDAPVDLVSVGDGGSRSVFVSGKNLLDLSNFTDRSVSGVTITNNRNGSITLVSDGTYERYYNGSVLMSVPSGRYKFIEQYSNEVAFVRLFPKGETTYTQYNAGTVFEYDSSTQDMHFLVQYDPGTITNTTVWPMICLATEIDDTYERYKGQHLSISTPNGLPGIPVSSGGNYTDANGQQWICDEIDFARGIYVKRVERFLFTVADMDGSESYPGWRNAGIAKYYPNASNAIGRYGAIAMCNVDSNPSQNVHINTTTGYDVILMPNPNEMTQTEWKTQYPNLVFDLIVSIPTKIETHLSEEELAAFSALYTYKGCTTVFNDAGAWMELEYVMDAKKYIDSVVAEPIARLSNVTILASKWVGADGLYSQVVSIPGITEYSKVDLLPSVEQLAIFHNKDVGFVTENEDGVVTVYAIGDKPLLDYTMQVSITEVKA